MIRRFLAALILAMGVSVLAVPATAQTPVGSTFTYQGRLTDGGQPYNGTADLVFRLFGAETGGTPAAPDIVIAAHPITDGLLTADLDFGAGAFAGDERWLELEVNGVPLTPRQPIRPAPYALFALSASGGSGSHWQLSGSAIYYSAGNVGIGTENPAHALDVEANGAVAARITNTAATNGVALLGQVSPGGSNFGVIGRKGAGSGGAVWNAAVCGDAESGTGVLGATSDPLGGIGVRGDAVTPTGTGAGVYGVANSPDGRGVSAMNYSQTGDAIGVLGSTNSPTGYAGHFVGGRNYFQGAVGIGTLNPQQKLSVSAGMNIDQDSANDGTLVSGLSFGGGSGEGIASKRTPGAGQFGLDFYTNYANRMTIAQNGQVGIGTTTPDAPLHARRTTVGTAIHGEVTTLGNGMSTGVDGDALGGTGTNYGIHGTARSSGVSYGVYGNAMGTGENYGVYGRALGGTSNFGGYFDGAVHVSGTLSKTAGSFKIDHPLDPANMYLSHSFVESPDMMNIYNGNVVTNAGGYAVVELPDYFEALNRDFRYQLTIIDETDSDAFVLAKVVRKIADNRFTIRTSAPNIEVSWQVTGIRQDAYAKHHPIVVEQDKPERERGKYLHPELYGEPEKLGLHRPRRPDDRARGVGPVAAVKTPVHNRDGKTK